MKNNEIELSISDDYAILELGNFRFYYGYEYGRDLAGEEVWGFYLEDDKHNRLLQITQDEMHKIANCPKDDYDCNAMLTFGIGLYLFNLINKHK